MIVTAEAMVFLCHNKICKKQLDTKFKRNNYQKIKGHLQELVKTICDVLFDRSTECSTAQPMIVQET